eukprot:gb/GEZN01005855.1/.p1 GENE.gb/GEZN01005855.1/~~gb/GEZN01005855.1/.p1  ORF type:complete len:322 (+),score=42.27 gb/GEZN01005855.1/:361-1326(+)
MLLWLLMPWTHGAEIISHLSIPLIHKYVVAVTFPKEAQLWGDRVLNFLRLGNLISDSTRHYLSMLWRDGSYLVLSAGFFFTPSFLTRLGCLLVGHVYPGYASCTDLASPASSEDRSVQLQGRLAYWTVFVPLNGFVDYAEDFMGSSLPFWFHGKLFGLLWLQLFRGHDRLLRPCLTVLNEILSKGSEVCEKLSKRQQQGGSHGDNMPREEGKEHAHGAQEVDEGIERKCVAINEAEHAGSDLAEANRSDDQVGRSGMERASLEQRHLHAGSVGQKENVVPSPLQAQTLRSRVSTSSRKNQDRELQVRKSGSPQVAASHAEN